MTIVRSLFSRLMSYLKPHWRAYAAGQAAMLAVTVTALAFPLAIRTIFDSAFGQGGAKTLITAIAVLAGVFVVREAAGYLKNLLLGRIGQQVTARVRQDAYERLQGIPMAQFDAKGSGHWLSILTNDINQFQGVVSGGIAWLVQSVLSLAGVLFLLFRLDSLLSLSLLTMLPLAFLVTKKLGARLEGISTIVQEKLGTLTSVISETVSGIDVIKGFTLEREATGLFDRENAIVLDKSEQAVRIQARTGMANGLLNSLYLLVITGFGAWRVFEGHMSPGDLVAFLLYTEMIYGPVLALSGLYLEVKRSTAAIRRIFGLLDAGGMETPDCTMEAQCENLDVQSNHVVIADPGLPASQRKRTEKGQITFDHVSFGYGAKTVLRDLSFTIESGETIALIGASGVGKSTLLKLIPRLYEAISGHIRIDGTDIRRNDPAELRRHIASVPQQTHLFSLSVRDNIACGRPDASDTEVEQAARMANAHEFILGMDHGYDTVLGENGANLSGGQKQRIALARAFIRNPDILLLDEATASLDTAAEKSVLQALHTLMKGRTTLIAAHKRTTIERADRVMVLEDQGISAFGTHEVLIRESATYRRLMMGLAEPVLLQG